MYKFRIVKLPVLLLTGCYVETDGILCRLGFGLNGRV